MMRSISFILPFLLAFLATDNTPTIIGEADTVSTTHYCGNDHVQNLLYAQDPTLLQKHLQLDGEAYNYFQSGGESEKTLYTLPIVVHIIHENGAENISDAVVIQGIQDLNDSYENVGYYDQGTGVDTEIQFCLAKRDPDGNPTTGINRIVNPLTEMVMETDDITVKDLSRWDPLSYINVWLVREICSAGIGCGVAGYAYFPASHGNPEDGIMMEASWLGSSPANSAVLSHEIGHYLGLYHTFQDGCPNNDCLADGDRVCDTPPDQSTAAVPCAGSANTCNTDVNAGDPNNPFTTDQNDMFWNYMDYGDWNCYSAFSQGQAERMDFFLNSVRFTLLDSEACQDPCPDPVDVSFTASTLIVPIGDAINFTNTSTNITNSDWQIDGVNFATTIDASYTFNTLGTYEITLIASNNTPNCFDDYTIEIEVICNTIAGFDPSATTVNLGEAVLFSNTTNNGLNYEWFLDGVSQGTTVDFSSTFNMLGVYEICLEAEGALCDDDYCFFIVVTDLADDCSQTFLKTFGTPGIEEKGYCITPSEDGNFYLGGSRQDSAMIIKMDPSGALLWERTFQFVSNDINVIRDLKLDSDNYLIGTGYGDGGGNNRDGFVFRYNPVANVFDWVQNHDHPTLGVFNGEMHEVSPGGNYLITSGTGTNSAPGLGCDAYIFELDRNTGAMTSLNEHYNLGSCETFQASQIYNGNLYTTGRHHFGVGGTDKMRGSTTRFDLAGNEIWSRLYLTDTNSDGRLYNADILVEQDSILVLHYGDKNGTAAANPEVFITKANLDGELAWAKEYVLDLGEDLYISEIVNLPDGYAVFGLKRTSNDVFILKINKDGEQLWAKSYGGGIDLTTGVGEKEFIFNDTYLYFIGQSTSFGGGDQDIVVGKVDFSNGEINSSCIYVQDIEFTVSDFPNPYQGLHPMTSYPSPVAATYPNVTPVEASLEDEVICSAGCGELCDNGLDDDGDGLIDCYDPDCCATEFCADNYYNECPIDCDYEPNSTVILMEVEWESSGTQDWCSYNTPITGDVDGDGVPEVIGKPCSGISSSSAGTYPNLLIVDGSSGVIEDVITTPAFYYLMDGPAIADIDFNGYAEIFIQASSAISNNNYAAGGPIITGDVRRRILCYEYDGTTYVEKWMSEVPAGYSDVEQAISVSLVDFNGDGIAEVYTQNQIFNSIDGSLIVQGGTATHRGWRPAGDNASLAASYSVAVDVLPDDFCANCTGLELVAGGVVYSVFIDPINPANSTMNVEVTLPNSNDGWTSIADVDKDGDLDAVITTHTGATGIVYVWDVQTPVQMFSDFNIATPAGFISQANIADFDGDGLPEIGVCSQFEYRVLEGNGANLSILWSIASDDWSGSTGSSVFDFNSDGISEVVYRAENEVVILDGATGTTLTSIPCQSGTRVEYPVVVDVDADGETEILCSCANTLKAMGSSDLPWVDARSVWNQHNYFNVNIEDDLTIPAQQQPHHIVSDSVVMNNFLTMYANPLFPVPDATVDVDSVECNDGILDVILEICNIGDNVLSNELPVTFYQGNPTSMNATVLATFVGIPSIVAIDSCITVEYSIPAIYGEPVFVVVNDDASLPGPYDLATDFPITPIGECDYTNNINNFQIDDSPPVLDLGPDILICDNGVFVLDAGPGFLRYEWNILAETQSITVFESGTYWVTTYSDCSIQTDTIVITIDPVSVFNLGPDTTICEGESVTLSAQGFDDYQWFPSDYLDCDTCETVVATPDSATTYIVVGSTDLGCISIDTIEINFGYGLGFDTIYLCDGESVIVFGDEVSGDGTYIDTVYNFQNCDSILTVTTLELDAIIIQIDGLTSCPGQTTGSAVATVNGGQAPYTFTWDPDTTGVNGLAIDNLAPGVYSLLVTDSNGCTNESDVFIDASTLVTVPFETIDVNCFGYTDGMLMIDSSGENLLYSLDSFSFQQSLVYENLAPGEYPLYIQDSLACIHEAFFVIGEPVAVAVVLPQDTTIILGDSIVIPSFTNILDSVIYQWTPSDYLNCIDCDRVSSHPTFSTSYTLVVTDENDCTASDEILILIDKEREVYIPNAFSPNGDGVNDLFMIYANVGVEEILTFRVFDRWGELVFEDKNFLPNDVAHGWDGMFLGKFMNPGVLVYMAEVRFFDGVELLYKGDVTLLK